MSISITTVGFYTYQKKRKYLILQVHLKSSSLPLEYLVFSGIYVPVAVQSRQSILSVPRILLVLVVGSPHF